LLPIASILLSSRAPIGLLAIAGVECCTNQGFKNIILNTEYLLLFQKIISPIFTNIINNRKENAYLAKIRDFLLPLLMNGQVSVKNIKNT